MEFNEYKKYKWFFTSSNKLVVGGKNATQNDELLKRLKKENKDFLVMHTASPGSPFSIIISDIKNITKSDREETAIFTACFSQAWKSKAKKARIHVFHLSDIEKSKSMKSGTWGVKKISEEIIANLELVLIKQNDILRAVPSKSAKSKEILLKINPGNVEKKDLLAKLAVILDNHFSESEILSALPAGGLNIKK